MLSRIRKTFHKEEESNISENSSRRSYLNVREFLDDLEVRSTISGGTVSTVIGSSGFSKKKSERSRKKNFLGIFNLIQPQNNGSSNNVAHRSVSLVLCFILVFCVKISFKKGL